MDQRTYCHIRPFYLVRTNQVALTTYPTIHTLPQVMGQRDILRFKDTISYQVFPVCSTRIYQQLEYTHRKEHIDRGGKIQVAMRVANAKSRYQALIRPASADSLTVYSATLRMYRAAPNVRAETSNASLRKKRTVECHQSSKYLLPICSHQAHKCPGKFKTWRSNYRSPGSS